MSKKPVEIEIFEAGTWTASNGSVFTITRADLQDTVDTFNPKYFRPPLIISHDTKGKKDSAIADSELCHGVPDYLKLVGRKLIAGFSKVSGQVRDWTREGMLHSISSSFYLPDSPHNPYPGRLSLRHIAALGKTPPSVKGLMPLEFNVFEEEEGVIEFSVMKTCYEICAELFQRYREYLIDSESMEVADQILPNHEIQMLRDFGDSEKSMYLARIEALENTISQLKEQMYQSSIEYGEGGKYHKAMKKKGMTNAQIAEKMELEEEEVAQFMSGKKKPSPEQQKLLDEMFGDEEEDEDRMDMSERMEALNRREKELDRREVTGFVDYAIKEGKLKSGERDRTIVTLLAASNTEEVEFSEGKKSLRQALMDEIDSRQPWNYAGEIVSPLQGSAVSMNFSAPTGYVVDRGGNELYAKVLSFAQSHNLDIDTPEGWKKALEGVTANA